MVIKKINPIFEKPKDDILADPIIFCELIFERYVTYYTIHNLTIKLESLKNLDIFHYPII